jgi:hypothetical protein
MSHLALTDSSNELSRRVLGAAKSGDMHKINLETANRARLLKIIIKFELEISNLVSLLDISKVSREEIEIIKSWSLDINKWIRFTEQIDQEINNQLMKRKEETTVEIATLYKNREKFKGYNLSTLK